MIKKKPRVLLVATLPPPVHGSSMVTMQIKDSKTINDAFDMDYVNIGTSRTTGEIGKRSYTLYFRKAFRFIASYFNLLGKLLSHRYDLIYFAITCHDVGFLKDSLFVLLSKPFCRKYVIHQHNKGMAPYADRPLYKQLYKSVYRRAKVILLSWRLYGDISSVVKKEQVMICPNGLPIPEPMKMIDTVEHEHSSVPKILFLSNLVASKGVWQLLDALKMLQERNVPFRCEFVGSTSRSISAGKFNSEVIARGLQEQVAYIGPQYGYDKWNAYRRADIFVLPSMDDCLPLTVIEAMMCRLPVVVTDVGAVPDLVKDGETGFIVRSEDLILESGGKHLDWNPDLEVAGKIERFRDIAPGKLRAGSTALADRLESLLVNPELRRTMGQSGYEYYHEKFTLEAFERTMQQCLEAGME